MAASEAVALLETLRAQAAEVAAHGRELLRRVRGGRLETREGLSLLELRPQLLLTYLQDLTLLAGSKARGGSLGLQGATLGRLLETRVVLEKLRPLEQRLRHLLEKLLRAAAAGGRGAEDPLSFRPAPFNMAAQDEEEEDDEGRGGGAKAPGLGGGRRYVPPRLVPVACDPPEEPEQRSRLRAWRRALTLFGRHFSPIFSPNFTVFSPFLTRISPFFHCFFAIFSYLTNIFVFHPILDPQEQPEQRFCLRAQHWALTLFGRHFSPVFYPNFAVFSPFFLQISPFFHRFSPFNQYFRFSPHFRPP
nr:neuroguidin isoform X1 [Taeniopygia guttata]